MELNNYFYKLVDLLLDAGEWLYKYISSHQWLKSIVLSSLLLLTLLMIYGGVISLMKGDIISEFGIRNSIILYWIIVSIDRLVQVLHKIQK